MEKEKNFLSRGVLMDKVEDNLTRSIPITSMLQHRAFSPFKMWTILCSLYITSNDKRNQHCFVWLLSLIVIWFRGLAGFCLYPWYPHNIHRANRPTFGLEKQGYWLVYRQATGHWDIGTGFLESFVLPPWVNISHNPSPCHSLYCHDTS